MDKVEFRLDKGYTTSNWEIDNNGFLVVDATIARIGVQEYRNEDGSIRREFRPPEEVSKLESLETFKLLPHCLEHPPMLLNDSNAKYYVVGFTGDNPVYENGYVKTKIKIIDKDAKEQALSGERREVSCGYTCRLEWISGNYKGEEYDCIQRDIKGNHTCQTLKGRAGKDVKLHIDSLSLNEKSNKSLHLNENDFTYLKEKIEFIKQKEILEKELNNEYVIKNDGKLDDLIVSLKPLKEKEKKEMRNIFGEINGLSENQKVTRLMEAYSELMTENQNLDSARIDAERNAALHEGRADKWRNELESMKSGNFDSSDYEGNNDRTESLKRQIKEKQIRCDSLEGENDTIKRQLVEVQRELRDAKSRNDTLSTELQEVNQTKRKDIVEARRDWLKAYQRVAPFLPDNAKTELQNDPTVADNRIALYRLAIQNVKPHVDLSSKTDSYIEGQFESIEDDYRNSKKNPQHTSITDGFRIAVDSAKNQSVGKNAPDLNQLRLSSIQSDSQAWNVTN